MGKSLKQKLGTDLLVREIAKIDTSYHFPAKHVPVSNQKIIEICNHFELEETALLIMNNPPEKEFRSDGCSMWADHVLAFNLYPACFLHNIMYWAGIHGEEKMRLQADQLFREYIIFITESVYLADLMFKGVRVGGTEMMLTGWSWAYGREDLMNPMVRVWDQVSSLAELYPIETIDLVIE